MAKVVEHFLTFQGETRLYPNGWLTCSKWEVAGSKCSLLSKLSLHLPIGVISFTKDLRAKGAHESNAQHARNHHLPQVGNHCGFKVLTY